MPTEAVAIKREGMQPKTTALNATGSIRVNLRNLRRVLPPRREITENE
ncbi:MAG TPA: hypothetical protein VM076_18300 [Gemmatimonadaceae bacterium]|nr:hypothetical protein [Gemmatimonadaceae bacterium]